MANTTTYLTFQFETHQSTCTTSLFISLCLVIIVVFSTSQSFHRTLSFTFSRTLNRDLSFIMVKTHRATPTVVPYTHWKPNSASFQYLFPQLFSPAKNPFFTLNFICSNQSTVHYRHEFAILHYFQRCKSLHKLL